MRPPRILFLCLFLLSGLLAAQLEPRGAETRVAAADAGQTLGAPAIARDAQGGFVVAWTRIVAGRGEARLRGFDRSGRPVSPETPVAPSSQDQRDPAVAIAADGGIAVVWTDGRRLLGRLFAAPGTPRSPAFEIDAGESRAPGLAALGAGSFVAVWAGRNPALGWDVRVRLLGPSGALGAAATLSNFPLESTRPSVSCSGGCAVVWDGYNAAGVNGVFLRRLDPAGAAIGDLPQMVVKTVLALAGSTVARDSQGGLLAAWIAGTAVQARRLDASGQPLADEMRIADSGVSLGQPGRLDAAADGAGRFLLAWGDCCGANLSPLSAALLDSEGRIVAGPAAFRPDLGGGLPAVFGGDDDFRLVWARGDSAPREILTEELGTPPDPCVADATTLCLTGGRFQVRALWRTAKDSGVGEARPLTADTGLFWFFSEESVEVVVKVLDACVLPGHHLWVFAAGLTNVAVTLEVTDTRTGAVRIYERPPGKAFEPIQDLTAFDCGD
jgi:hypothetical protein